MIGHNCVKDAQLGVSWKVSQSPRAATEMMSSSFREQDLCDRVDCDRNTVDDVTIGYAIAWDYRKSDETYS